MAPEKTYPLVSFRLGVLAPVVDARIKGDRDNGARAEALREMVARYDLICRRDQPKFSVAEWKLICDVMNGVWTSDGGANIPMIWAEVSDGIRLNAVDKKWRVKGAALVEKIRALTAGQTIAVLDTVERFWVEVANGNQDAKVPGE